MKMLTTCKRCGKISQSARSENCPNCMEYLGDNPCTELDAIALSQTLNIEP